jgi:acyl-CoA thioester hydrolase
MDISKFKHTYVITVRNYEIDWQGIVHNGNYLLYFEVARIDYFRQLGMEIDQKLANASEKIVVVRNEIDYYNSATFNDQLKIYTRLIKIGNSSFANEALMFHVQTNVPVAKNVATMVWLDPKANKSTPVPHEFRKMAQKFEGRDCDILWPTIEV